MGEGANPRLTAVVIAFEEAAQLESAVRAALAQQTSEPFEVIAVTSGRDGAAERLARALPALEVVDLGARALPGTARNAGLRRARGEIVSFPGSHVRLAPGSLEARMRAHARGHAMVSGTPLCGTTTRAGWAAYFLDHHRKLPRRPAGPLDHAPDACSYRRADLEALGGFPDLRVGEDTVVNRALFDAGARAYFDPAVRYYHDSPCTTAARLARHHFGRGRGLARILLTTPAGRAQLRTLGLRGYAWPRLRSTHRNVGRWGRPLLRAYLASLPWIALGVLAAWSGIHYEVLVRRAQARVANGRALRPLWRAAYRAVLRACAWWLARRAPGTTVYVRGSAAEGDFAPGVSDLDLLVVPARGGEQRVRDGARALRARVAPFGRVLDVGFVRDDAELAAGLRTPPALYGLPELRSAWFGPAARPDDGVLLERAPAGGPQQSLRRLAGPERRPPRMPVDAAARRLYVWALLQRWWAYGAQAAAQPPQAHTGWLCVKLIAEPLRAYLWLVHGELPASRAAALRRGTVFLPEEEAGFAAALALLRRPVVDDPPLALAVATLHRLSVRIARRLADEVRDAGTTAVALHGGAGDARALPLADWRALVVAAALDETFTIVPGAPADLAALERAAQAADTYQVLADADLLAFPAAVWRRGAGRAIHCRLTDPVSWALAAGERVAHFPEVPGWRIADVARRAVAEHRGMLTDPRFATDAGRLASAARAGLLLESVEAGAPVLALTTDAAMAVLAERGHPGATRAALRALPAYRTA
jgi:hypothetical protein